MGDDLEALEQRLKAARAAWDAFVEKDDWSGGQEYNQLTNAVYLAEKEFALAQGVEAAEIIDWPERWCTGAPLPHVVASEQETLLIYMLADPPDPNWDGTTVQVKDAASGNSEDLAIVTFDHCVSHRFGDPNDEVADGHPLHGKGLSWYSAHVVRNSMWIAELEAINSVHEYYNPANWKALKHYLLCFHDSEFECLATGHEVKVVKQSFREALADAIIQVTE